MLPRNHPDRIQIAFDDHGLVANAGLILPATLTLHDGHSFGVVRQGLALRRRSLYDRLRAIAEYDYTRRPDNVLILVPSVWEERLTTRFCEERNLRDCFVAVGSRDALESRGLRLSCHPTWVFGNSYHSLSCLAFHKLYSVWVAPRPWSWQW